MTYKKIDWGFDLTDFRSVSNFKSLLNKHKLVKYKRIKRDYGGGGLWAYVYSWKRNDGSLEIRTGNNPITGAYSSPKQRANQKGYASYIGIHGKPEDVMNLVKDIRNFYPKGESKRLDFIW